MNNHTHNLKIEYKISKEVFVLFAALNLMGYDDENNNRGMYWARKKLRNILLKNNWNKKYPQLQNILKKYHPYWLLNAIFLKLLGKNINKKSVWNTYFSNLENFSKEPLIKKTWLLFKNLQIKESKKPISVFKKEVNGLVKFLRVSIKDSKKIVIIFNSLDAYWRGYSFKIDKTIYIVAGPGADKNRVELLRHELLHCLDLKFHIDKNILKINKKLISMGYSSKKIINCEYIVRALNIIYESQMLNKNISKLIQKERQNFPKIKEVVGDIQRQLKIGNL
ncbi:MAG: hypothetical protein Athens071426_452 [Parcubacteria group bacterium Athens0714_26]|nr:MAG: hypothetical protein Athens101426_45 [Parcubacteria group bacterium Athens1014_26]TSD02605.1 MAG: hypothetical protein Athens071426_452 [Parcubacteria group bacterium Athens0714_26]